MHLLHVKSSGHSSSGLGEVSSQSQPAAENNVSCCSEVCIAFSHHLLGCIYTACTSHPGRTARLGWGRFRHSRSLNQRWMYKSNRFPIVLSDQETNEFAFFGKRLIMMTHCNQVKTRASPQLAVSVYVITRPIHHLAAGTCTACTPGPAGRTRQR